MDFYHSGNYSAIWRKKIPELMRGIGQGVREFNDAKKSVKSQIEDGMKEKDRAAEEKK